MPREVRTEITINAAKEKIWQELTNFSAYPSWNPFAKSIQGELSSGSTLAVTIDVPNSGIMKFKPRVIDVQANKSFSWQGKLLVKGVFDGRHSFEIQEKSEQECLLIHKEDFSGIMVPMVWKKLDVNSRLGFMNMNKALKERCEATE